MKNFNQWVFALRLHLQLVLDPDYDWEHVQFRLTVADIYLSYQLWIKAQEEYSKALSYLNGLSKRAGPYLPVHFKIQKAQIEEKLEFLETMD